MDKNVLIIDNDEVIAYLSSCVLKDLGNNAYYCTNGMDLVEKVKRHPQFFNLVICSQAINGFTETDIAEELYTINSEISIIMLSGNKKKQKRYNAYPNIKDIILKPVSKEILNDSIRNVFGQIDVN